MKTLQAIVSPWCSPSLFREASRCSLWSTAFSKFNETTHRMAYTQVKANGLWIFWRIALAGQFSASIDDFLHCISLDNSGTYLNGYMLVDAKNGETGLVEMSYRCFVYCRSSGGAYTVTSKSLDGQACSTDYDPEIVDPDYLTGINFPASIQVRTDLKSTNNRPARIRQFSQLLPGVIDVATAKGAITYTAPATPLSIFGLWDLGYGETAYPKMVPDGSIDAKVGTTEMVRSFMALSGDLDLQSKATGFWMRYGTPWSRVHHSSGASCPGSGRNAETCLTGLMAFSRSCLCT